VRFVEEELMRWAALGLLLLVQESRLETVDVYIDTGDQPLAAFQFELTSNAKIVGIENGVLDDTPPYYDPAALQGGRIIVADFTTAPNPPSGKIRVATLMFYAEAKSEYVVKLVAAAVPGGKRMEAKIEAVKRGGN
jgi:hypothetical protein